MFCEENGIKRKLSSRRTPDQNRINKRRNRLVAKAVRAMLFENDVPKTFWREEVYTTIYTLNRVQIREGMDKAPYELWFGYSPLVKYFTILGSKCYINTDNDVGKFDPRSDEGMFFGYSLKSMFLGYSLKSKAYRCFNYRTKTIVECTNLRIDEKFGTIEKMLEYDFDEEDDTSGMANRIVDIFLETNNDL